MQFKGQDTTQQLPMVVILAYCLNYQIYWLRCFCISRSFSLCNFAVSDIVLYL